MSEILYAVILAVILVALVSSGFQDRPLTLSERPLTLSERLADIQERHPDWSEELCEGVARGRYTEELVVQNPEWPWDKISEKLVTRGMTKDMVVASWGTPREAIRVDSDSEIHCYSLHYLLFTDGFVEDWDRIVTATELISDYAANELAADKEYKGQTIVVEGRIDSISKEETGVLVVVLQGRDYSLTDIRCHFPSSSEESLLKLQGGQMVTIKGRCIGKGLFGIFLVGCSLFP